MVRRLLQITLLGAAIFAFAAYGLAGVIPPHECNNVELSKFSCENPGYCTNACGFYCRSQIECARCCDQFRTNQAAAECMHFCGLAMAAPADYLAD